MKTDVTVRVATPDDWPGMWAALEPTFRSGESYANPRDITETEARAFWTGPPSAAVLVAVDGDEFQAARSGTATVLGTAKYLPNHPGAGSHVANASFVVGPAGVGRRVGRALAVAVLQAARDDGFTAMQFNAVVATNDRAIRLWQSLGFEILATIPSGFDHPRLGLVGLHIMHRFL